MSEENIKLYSKELKPEDFELSELWGGEGHAVLEFQHENKLRKLSEIPDIDKKYLISAILFDGEKQLKARRTEENNFRIIADFEIPDANSSEKTGLTVRSMSIFLWGYINKDLPGYFYEERIPELFQYPIPDGITWSDRDRVCIEVCNYYDQYGRIFWSRFVKLKK